MHHPVKVELHPGHPLSLGATVRYGSARPHHLAMRHSGSRRMTPTGKPPPLAVRLEKALPFRR